MAFNRRSKNITEGVARAPNRSMYYGMGYTEGDFGKPLGLTSDWAVRVIKAVGNYGEVFDRNVGAHSKLGIPRGLNELWNNGGIQYAPPIR